MANRQVAPGLPFDIEALTAAQQRGLDAFSTASRITAESLQGCMRRQLELTQQLMEDMRSSLGSLRAEDPRDMAGLVGQQIQQMTSCLDRSFACGREVTEMFAASQREAWEVLQECCRTNIAELGGETQETATVVGGTAAQAADTPARTTEEAARRAKRTETGAA
ncbi:phasin family protein [Geminicoccaceae bacterium 1502E]|nr:phasin family protein [Geminicoccaceae bacterium 1502E]